MQDGRIQVGPLLLIPAMVETKIDSSVQAWVLSPEGTGTRKRSARPMAALPRRGTILTPGQGFDGVLAASAGSPPATAADACTCSIISAISQAVKLVISGVQIHPVPVTACNAWPCLSRGGSQRGWTTQRAAGCSVRRLTRYPGCLLCLSIVTLLGLNLWSRSTLGLALP